MKYIVTKDSEDSLEEMIIFPETIDHLMMYHNIGNVQTILVSAGFIYNDEGNMYCTGKSHSLNKNSRPSEDTLLAKRMFRRF